MIQYQTELKTIYAAGDVIGWPSLASAAAYDQGRCIGANMSGEDAKPVRGNVPYRYLYHSEISSIGRNEQN